jgi:hypothetical protein
MIWSTPTYQGSISGSFKNALDWLILLAPPASRPAICQQGQWPRQVGAGADLAVDAAKPGEPVTLSGCRLRAGSELAGLSRRSAQITLSRAPLLPVTPTGPVPELARMREACEVALVGW